VTIMPLNLPQELVSTIGQMTQVSLSATEELDAHHFKSHKLQNADRSKIKVILMSLLCSQEVYYSSRRGPRLVTVRVESVGVLG
jgi:hypothetical protein